MKFYTFASIVLLVVVLSFSLGNIAISKVTAESGVGKDVFKLVVSLYGITNSTKQILTIANVADSTKIKLYDPENPDTEGSDKVSYVFTFPGVAVDAGERYNVCTVQAADFKLKCEHGSNSPLNRPEFVDIKVSENPSEKVSENPSEKKK
jgi:hypothetical protein